MTEMTSPSTSDTLTFLFTDIEGSTQLWERDPKAMHVALARHDTILRQAIETCNGRVFKTMGDAFYAVFPDAFQALEAAMTAQRALHAEIWGETPIKVRMAIHTGAAEMRDGDYFGLPLNRVARLLSAAHGGQTLLSAATEELTRDNLPQNTALRDMGERHLKDLLRPEHIYQLLALDLPSEFPPLKTLDAFRTNLPPQLTSFIGREKEIAAVKGLVARNRLVTLTGAGGAGKTRLSLQVAADLLDSFPDGVLFVELAPLTDPALIPQTVMSTLGLREEGDQSALKILSDYLRTKIALLILDNCEHLIEAAAQLAEDLLQVCRPLHILSSSREALDIPGEITYRVPSLSTPDARHLPSIETLFQYESAQLFIERARAAQPTFAVTNENALVLAQVCARLDGIPLAIELAAARVKMLKVEQIAERLDDRFRLLTSGSRTALPHHQTLRALIDWSYDLLPETERALLRRLSAFAGGWTIEAAETICQGKGIKDYDVLEPLTQLVNKSLVIVDADSGTETRYRLLETVRQYAREKLSETGEGIAVRNCHLQYFLGLVERAESELIGPRMPEWVQRLKDEMDNIRASLEWSLKQDIQVGLRLASSLRQYWSHHGDMREGVNWLSQLLLQPAAAIPNNARADALAALAYLHNSQYVGIKAEPFARQSLAIYREQENQRGIAFALSILGYAICAQDDYITGRPLVFESLALYRKLGDKFGIARTLNYLGSLVDDQDYQRACAYLKESLALCRELGHATDVITLLIYLGRLSWRHGDFTAARAWLTEALAENSLSKFTDSLVVEALGELSMREGNYEQAIIHLEKSVSLTRERGRFNVSYWQLAHLGFATLRQGDHARARAIFAETLQYFKEAGLKIGVAYSLEGLASLAVMQTKPERAAQILAWTDVVREAVGDIRPLAEQAEVDRDLATIRAQLGTTAFAAAQAAGQAMSMDEVIAYALESPFFSFDDQLP